ncbi:Adenine deaminase [Clostridiaceae bacterium JG1575]|nr:Adenine deaminase [Clostridiaceae bacterium JG1575]
MDLTAFVQVARGDAPADLVLKNATLLDVFQGTVTRGDLALFDGTIVGIGPYHGKQEVDLEGRFVTPGFIDGHMHMESSLLAPPEYARAVLPHGVTTLIADPHELTNVAGKTGMEWLMKSAEDLPLDILWMVPSCVPSAPVEHAGERFSLSQMLALKDQPKVLGLGEMMAFPQVVQGDPEPLAKINAFKDRPKDGHAPGLTGRMLNAYAGCGILTEHECSTREEMQERLRLGFYLQIREGTAAHNAAALLPGVTKDNWRRIFFCTDDKHPHEILREGTIDHLIRLALAAGIPMEHAYTMASFNACEAYGLHDRGALAPGRRADLVILDDPHTVSIREVLTAGRVVYRKGQPMGPLGAPPPWTQSNIQLADPLPCTYPLNGRRYRALVMNPGSLWTNLEEGAITTPNFPYDQGMTKLTNTERHHGLPLQGVVALRGFPIQGAIASTIAHDAHHLICAGSCDEDIALAVKEAALQYGGLVLVQKGQVLGRLPLPIGGLLSDRPVEEVSQKLVELEDLAHSRMGLPAPIDPFVSLSFMALPVIPEVKLTVEGLFSVTQQRILPSVEP